MYRPLPALTVVGIAPCTAVLDERDSYLRMWLTFIPETFTPHGEILLNKQDLILEQRGDTTIRDPGIKCEMELALESGQILDFRLIIEGEPAPMDERASRVHHPTTPILAENAVPCLGPLADLRIHKEYDHSSWLTPSLSYVTTETHDVLFFSNDLPTGRIVVSDAEFGITAASELAYIAWPLPKSPKADDIDASVAPPLNDPGQQK